MIVVDASAIVDVILARPSAVTLLDRLFMRDRQIVVAAPDFIDAEVVASLRRSWFRKLVDEKQVAEALVYFDFLPIERRPSRGLALRVWELRHNVKPYDAAYVALAELLDAPLITRDKRLANSSGHRARIEYIA
ncbi:MAG TPA: type II toxin-antitoxin system VapC family toxin [Thermoanaerobaculia bacterium]|nr:type II toxin-antitoxin system VapC family toxin [Thermoanaerobaculia bacterium]